MKKSLLALAVLGAFAGAASAQTNVTIYGIADVGISYTDNGAATNSKTWAMTSGNQSGSRLGFRGTEDLGGGMSALFTLENGFALDTGALGTANTLFNRQAFVGLKGGFGTVTLGRQYTAYHVAVDTIDPFGTGLAGSATNLFMSVPTLGSLYPTRASNTINYALPLSGGLSASVAYSLGETAGDNSANRQIGFGVGYANGPINAQLAYHTFNTNVAGVDTDTSGLFLGGTYDFRVAKAHLAFSNNELELNTPAGPTQKSRNYLVGVSAPVGAGTILASWVRNDVRTAGNVDSDQFAIGYTHSLSKRTNLYTSYGRTDNDASADTSLFNVGIRHKF